MCAIPSVILIFQMYMNQVIPDSICPFETPDYKTWLYNIYFTWLTNYSNNCKQT